MATTKITLGDLARQLPPDADYLDALNLAIEWVAPPDDRAEVGPQIEKLEDLARKILIIRQYLNGKEDECKRQP